MATPAMRSTITLARSSDLPASAAAVWQAVLEPATFRFVTSPLLRLPALSRRVRRFEQGDATAGRLWLLGVLPLHRHHLELVSVDPRQRTLQTREWGGLVRSWVHHIAVEERGTDGCRYTDTVTVEAGPWTLAVALAAWQLYGYRHRRWHLLARKL